MQHNRIISFDVGIKNMAYCIFDVVSSPLTISIVDWNVLNVAQLSTEEKEECPTCQYVMTSGKQAKVCGKKSKYHKQNHYVCEKHAKASHKYRMPLAEHSEKHLKKMLEAGVIEPADSEWAAPPVLIRKKDGNVRYCIDYRKLNNVTKKDSYPLPLISESLDALSGNMFFSTLDMASGYWQIEVEERDRPKTAFVTRYGLFQKGNV